MARYSAAPSEVSAAISRRFFAAVVELVASGAVSSLSGLCDAHGLSSPRYRELRLLYGVNADAAVGGSCCRYKAVELDALAVLVREYGVSAEWLLCGRGSMYVKTPKTPADEMQL